MSVSNGFIKRLVYTIFCTVFVFYAKVYEKNHEDKKFWYLSIFNLLRLSWKHEIFDKEVLLRLRGCVLFYDTVTN